MEIPAKLSLEQQFKLQVLRDQVKVLSKEQAQEYLIEVFRQMMVKDNLVKNLLKNQNSRQLSSYMILYTNRKIIHLYHTNYS